MSPHSRAARRATSTGSSSSTNGATTITGTPTGYRRPRRAARRGCSPATLIVVGARPAMGKTSFALGMVANAALQAQPAGAVLLARDEPARDQPAAAVLRGARRCHPGAQRQAQRGRLDEDLHARRTSRRGAHLDRRQPEHSPSWRSGPRPGGSRAGSATSAWSSSTTSSS